MALHTTVSPSVTEDPHVPGIPDDGDGNLAGEIDRNDVPDWGYDSTYASPFGFEFENPDWSTPEIDIGQGRVYRLEPDGQKLYTVESISNVSLKQDADNYIFFTADAEFEVHDVDEPPSEEAVLIGIIDTLNNRIDDDVRGRSPIPPEFIQVFTGTGAASAPLEVTTLNVDAIASTEARLIGNLNGLGGANQATVYFQYREATASTWQQTNEQTRATAGEFDADVDSLTAGTTHIFRAIARNSAGQVVLGDEEQFSTLAAGTTNPTIVTDPVGTVTADSADLNGELTSLGSYSDVFCFFQREKLDSGTTLLVPGGPTLSSTGTYQITANALVAGTKYRYRAVGDYGPNDDKRVTGDWVTFTTSGGSGLGVTTDAETGVGDHTATLNGTLDNMGPNTSVDVGFEFRETGDSVWRRRNAGFVTTTGSFSFDFDELISGTAYEFRATAEGGGVTATGTTETFTTTGTPPGGTFVAHYKLDSGSGTTAVDSEGSNDGSIVGASWTTDAKTGGQALDFDGSDDRVELPDLGIDEQSSWTIMGWFKADNIATRPTVFGYHDGSDAQVWLTPNIDGGAPRFEFGGLNAAASNTLNNGTWYHLAGVFDASVDEARVYLDGLLETTDTGNLGSFTSGTPWIGRRSDGNEPMDGPIDDVRVFNEVKSQSEIQTIYNNTV